MSVIFLLLVLQGQHACQVAISHLSIFSLPFQFTNAALDLFNFVTLQFDLMIGSFDLLLQALLFVLHQIYLEQIIVF